MNFISLTLIPIWDNKRDDLQSVNSTQPQERITVDRLSYCPSFNVQPIFSLQVEGSFGAFYSPRYNIKIITVTHCNVER